MNEERRVFDIFQDDARFGGYIGRKLDDLCCEIFYVGNVRFKILVLRNFRLNEGFDICLEIGIIGNNRTYLEACLTLYDNSSSTIRHFDEFNYPCDGTDIFKICLLYTSDAADER